MFFLFFHVWILATAFVVRQTAALSVNNITASSLQLQFIEQPTDTITWSYPFSDAAFGQIGRKLWIIGGYDYTDEWNPASSTPSTSTRYIDLETLEMIDASITIPISTAVFWTDSFTVAGNSIYFTCSQSTNFYKFDSINKTYTTLSSLPNGWGLSSLVSYYNENNNEWYIYSIGGSSTNWWPALNTTYIYNISTDTWTLMPGRLKIGRIQHSCTIADSNSITNQVRIYAFGGKVATALQPNNTIEYCVIDTGSGSTNTMKILKNNCYLLTNQYLIHSKLQPFPFMLNNNLLIIMGGQKDVTDTYNDIEILDINTNILYNGNETNVELPNTRARFVYVYDTDYSVIYIWSGNSWTSGNKALFETWEIGCIYDTIIDANFTISETPNGYLYDDTSYVCSLYSSPTQSPQPSPTQYPTDTTNIPTQSPSMIPTSSPLTNPTNTPSLIPTVAPSIAPLINPTNIPSQPPTTAPSISPLINPTITPTMSPSDSPSMSPTRNPTLIPTNGPTMYDTSYGVNYETIIEFNTTLSKFSLLQKMVYQEYISNKFENVAIDTEFDPWYYKSYISEIAGQTVSRNNNNNNNRQGQGNERRSLLVHKTYEVKIINQFKHVTDDNIDIPTADGFSFIDQLTNENYDFESSYADYLNSIEFETDTYYNFEVRLMSISEIIVNETASTATTNAAAAPTTSDDETTVSTTQAEKLSTTMPSGAPTPSPTKDSLSIQFSYNFTDLNTFTIIAGFISIFVILLTLFLSCHAKFSTKLYCCQVLCGLNDSIKRSAIVLFFVHVHSFIIDTVFAIYLYLKDYYILSYISFGSLISSYLFSFVVFLYLKQKWSFSNEGAKHWLHYNSTLLFKLSLPTGSVFPAIEVCNSRALGLDMFNMGLTRHQMHQFRTWKLAVLMASENIPQLLVTISYYAFNEDFDTMSILTLTINLITLILDLSIFIVKLIDSKTRYGAVSAKIRVILDKQDYKIALPRTRLYKSLGNVFAAILKGAYNKSIEILYCRPILDTANVNEQIFDQFRRLSEQNLNNKNKDAAKDDDDSYRPSSQLEYGFIIGIMIELNSKDQEATDYFRQLKTVCKNGLLAESLRNVWKIGNKANEYDPSGQNAGETIISPKRIILEDCYTIKGHTSITMQQFQNFINMEKSKSEQAKSVEMAMAQQQGKHGQQNSGSMGQAYAILYASSPQSDPIAPYPFGGVGGNGHDAENVINSPSVHSNVHGHANGHGHHAYNNSIGVDIVYDQMVAPNLVGMPSSQSGHGYGHGQAQGIPQMGFNISSMNNHNLMFNNNPNNLNPNNNNNNNNNSFYIDKHLGSVSSYNNNYRSSMHNMQVSQDSHDNIMNMHDHIHLVRGNVSNGENGVELPDLPVAMGNYNNDRDSTLATTIAVANNMNDQTTSNEDDTSNSDVRVRDTRDERDTRDGYGEMEDGNENENENENENGNGKHERGESWTMGNNEDNDMKIQELSHGARYRTRSKTASVKLNQKSINMDDISAMTGGDHDNAVIMGDDTNGRSRNVTAISKMDDINENDDNDDNDDNKDSDDSEMMYGPINNEPNITDNGDQDTKK